MRAPAEDGVEKSKGVTVENCYGIEHLGNPTTLDIMQTQHIQSYYSEKISKGRTDGKCGLSAQSVLGTLQFAPGVLTNPNDDNDNYDTVL